MCNLPSSFSGLGNCQIRKDKCMVNAHLCTENRIMSNRDYTGIISTGSTVLQVATPS